MKTCGKKSKGKNLIEDIRKKIVSSHIKKNRVAAEKNTTVCGARQKFEFSRPKMIGEMKTSSLG
jgi:hypothetical protein